MAATSAGGAARKSQLTVTDCDWLGFDLDHTFVRYNLPNLVELIHRALVTCLVERSGYDRSLLETKPTNAFFAKGIVFDLERGHFLKLSRSGRILRATHGHAQRELSEAELKAAYGEEMVLRELARQLRTGERPATFFAFCTYFDMPASCVLAHIVDLIDRDCPTAEAKAAAYKKLPEDVFGAFNHNFNSDHFSKQEGYYFPEMIAHPEKYLQPCSAKLKDWLAGLRRSGKHIFLLTNSHGDYTEHLMDHSFGPNWREAFDLIIVKGEKPRFFQASTGTSPFYTLSGGCKAGEPIRDLKAGHTFVHGNQECLMRFLTMHAANSRGDEPTEVPETAAESEAQQGPPLRIMYFGDHLTGDVMAVRNSTDWHAVAIVEELLLLNSAGAKADAASAAAAQQEDERLLKMLEEAAEAWGPFCAREEQAGETTEAADNEQHLWDTVVREHADIALPHVDALVDLVARCDGTIAAFPGDPSIFHGYHSMLY